MPRQSASGAIVPNETYLKKLLSVESDRIPARLLEFNNKLESRFHPQIRPLLNAEEQKLAQLWDSFKPCLELQDLFQPRILFSSLGDKAKFESLLRFSDCLIELDSELIQALRVIVGHKSTDKVFPVAPDWLKVSKVLLALEGSKASPQNLFLSSTEVRSLISDMERASLAEAKEPTKPKNSTRKISEIGFQWCYFEKGDSRYGLKPGWEPQLIGTRYKNSSIFRLPKKGLEAALEKVRSTDTANKEKIGLLEKVIDNFYNQDQRREFLKDLRKKFPPPASKTS